MNNLRARHDGFLQFAICISFQRGEGRNGHVRSEWGLFAICSVLDLYNCSRLVSDVHHPGILQE